MPAIAGTLANDFISGTSEADYAIALAGQDTVQGFNGADWLAGNLGNDQLDGGAGNDTLFGGKDHDVLNGGTGADLLFGDAGDDVILAGDGNDFVAGGAGNDPLFGNNDDDILIGNAGDDVLNGESGDDILLAGTGNDQLFGGAGDDTLSGDRGTDILAGGTGRNVFLISPRSGGLTRNTADIISDFQPGIDRIALSEGLTLANLAILQNGNETLIRLRQPNGNLGDYLVVLAGVNATAIAPDTFIPSNINLTHSNLPSVNPPSNSSGGVFVSSDQGQLTINLGELQPPSAETVRNNLFGTPIVNNPLAGVDPFLNPQGTQLIRDPFTGQFVPLTVNQPGSIFSPGGLATTPGITDITPAQLPSAAVGPFYLDFQGIPRPVGQLTLGGGTIPPLIDPTGNLVEAQTATGGNPATPPTEALPPLYLDFQGVARLSSQLAAPIPGDPRYLGFTGAIAPLLTSTGEPVLARDAVLATISS